MKRAIVALALVGTLLLSVVTCQIYNPADNSTLYTAMRTEGAISKTDYLAEFQEATTAEEKVKYFDEYDADSVATYRQQSGNKVITNYGELFSSENLQPQELLDAYKSFSEKYTSDWVIAYKNLETVYEKAFEVVKNAGSKVTGEQENTLTSAEDSLKRYGVDLLEKLWTKKYAVNWDWNSDLGKVN